MANDGEREGKMLWQPSESVGGDTNTGDYIRATEWHGRNIKNNSMEI